MKNYNEIKTKHQDNYNALTDKYKMFFAFSKEQLEEGKAKIGVLENKNLVSIGMGGFMPKANLDAFLEGSRAEDKRYKKELKEAKEAKEQAIVYELNNHECFYAGNNIEDVIDIFKGIYTKQDILKIYKKQLVKEKKFINKEND